MGDQVSGTRADDRCSKNDFLLRIGQDFNEPLGFSLAQGLPVCCKGK